MPETHELLTDAEICTMVRTTMRQHGYGESWTERPDDEVVIAHPLYFTIARLAYKACRDRDDLTTAQREAARKAWDAAREYWWEHGFNGRGGVDLARNTYLAATYPLPARECVEAKNYRVHYNKSWGICPYRVTQGNKEVFACALASQVSAWLGKRDDGFHMTDEEMAQLLAFAAGRGEG